MDRIKSTKTLATDLLRLHGLTERGWRFELDRAKSRCGICYFDSKIISVSRNYVEEPTVPFDDIKNTILHEIAHAIAGHTAGHGDHWKQVARSIGCNGNTYNSVWKGVEKKYNIHCKCGKINLRRHRVSPNLRRKVCSACKTLLIEARKLR